MIVAILTLAFLALIFSLALVIAAIKFEVKIDPKVKEVEEALPGINCGGCGAAGCSSFADHLVMGKSKLEQCSVAGFKIRERLAEILGVEVGIMTSKVAKIKCGADHNQCSNKYKYHGILSCKAANLVSGGRRDCEYGCLGFGDCVQHCSANAIEVKQGLAQIDASKCNGCGLCIQNCPKQIISMVPATHSVTVLCSSKEIGATTRKSCQVGCIGCKKCEKKCPENAIIVEDNLAKIDPQKCNECGTCVPHCPTQTIQFLISE